MSVLKAEEIHKAYRGEMACGAEKLQFGRGVLSVVAGPSGAGKTTLLRILSGLTAPQRGQVFFRGRPLYREGRTDGRLPARKMLRDMVMVFQKPNLFTGTTAYNIEYGLKLRGISAAQRSCSGREAARLVGIEECLKRQVSSLSAGEAQRVAVARALAVQPTALLLDEPTANLDPANVKMIEHALVHACRQTEAAVIMVSHNLAQTRRLADRVILLQDGEVDFDGPAGEFFHRPDTRRHRNFLRGEIMS